MVDGMDLQVAVHAIFMIAQISILRPLVWETTVSAIGASRALGELLNGFGVNQTSILSQCMVLGMRNDLQRKLLASGCHLVRKG